MLSQGTMFLPAVWPLPKYQGHSGLSQRQSYPHRLPSETQTVTDVTTELPASFIISIIDSSHCLHQEAFNRK